MVLNIDFVPANLATVCIESLLYGMFLVLFISSTYLLVYQGPRKVAVPGPGSTSTSILCSPMFMAAIIIFCSVTGHWICTVIRLFDAFVNYERGTNPVYIYANLALTSEVAKTAFLVVTVATSDATLIYRLYVIWGRNNWVIIFPSLTWLALLVCGSGVCWQFALYNFSEDVYTSLAGRWITSDCAFTFATNMYCSALISWRVWRSHARTKSYGGSSLMTIVAMVVESALIHTWAWLGNRSPSAADAALSSRSWNLLFFILFQLKTKLEFIAIDCWCPISGIAFMLINLRVAFGWAQKATTEPSSSTTVHACSLPQLCMHQEECGHLCPVKLYAIRVTDEAHGVDSMIEGHQRRFADDALEQAV